MRFRLLRRSPQIRGTLIRNYAVIFMMVVVAFIGSIGVFLLQANFN